MLVEHFVAAGARAQPALARHGAGPRGGRRAGAPCRGRATCASWRTWSSGWWCSAAERRWTSPTLRLHAALGAPDVHPLAAGRRQEQVVPLRQLEGEYIAWVVAHCGGNKTRAAELLGIDVSTIHRRERADSGISQR